MSTFRASVRIDDGMLHVSRPLTAPERIADAIDALVYAVRNLTADDRLTIDVEVETAEESDTPIADGIVGTSSTPLAADRPDDDEDAADVPLTAPLTSAAVPA